MKTRLLTMVFGALSVASSSAITIFGLGADGNLYSFDSSAPGVFTNIGTPGNGITDIDFRGSNGALYGLSSNGSFFRINISTGASTLANSPATALNGNVSSFDVNPVADRFRVGTDASTGTNNYRLTSNMMQDTNVVTDDGTFITPGFTILDVAYTNPFSNLSTTLYSIGSDGSLYVHSGSPQFNTLTSSGSVGFIPDAGLSFDIGQDGFGYFTSGGNLYRINHVGTASPSVDNLGALAQPLVSISAIPEPSTALLCGFAALGLLRRRR